MDNHHASDVSSKSLHDEKNSIGSQAVSQPVQLPTADFGSPSSARDPVPVSSQPSSLPNIRVPHVPRTTVNANGFIVGTPSAVGAIRPRKSSTIPQLLTHAPTRRSPLAVNNPVVPQSVLVHNYDELSDPEGLEFEREDARLVLEVARSRRTICRLEQQLAQAKIDENIALCTLFKYRAEEAERRLEGAEYDIGCVRNMMRSNGVTIPASDASGPRSLKRPRSGSSVMRDI
ncbi:hypothetical protein OG21DRAFT_1516024 [Imleria badia]|nr:hypothetical protein OG21DRAFT_1516024 [Imleria badia]